MAEKIVLKRMKVRLVKSGQVSYMNENVAEILQKRGTVKIMGEANAPEKKATEKK